MKFVIEHLPAFSLLLLLTARLTIHFKLMPRKR